jgi:hypothetical protein
MPWEDPQHAHQDRSRRSNVIAIAAVAIALALLARCLVWRRRPPEPLRQGHPESMTAVLEGGAEEYLARLAYELWPEDEYLDLEEDWRAELGPADEPYDHEHEHEDAHNRAACPRCRTRGADVWPCLGCGRLLHSACGHGMRRRPVAEPYRTQDMGYEAVVAEWVCVGCSSVVALDVGHGDEEPGGDIRR